MMNDFFDVIAARRSVRSYKDDPVPDELIRKLIDAACWAPSGGNLQPWTFYVIKDQQTKESIVQATYIGFDKETGRPQQWINTAPVLILIGADMKRPRARYGSFGTKLVVLDVAAAIENLLLAATALGLGSCWIAGFDTAQITQILRLPKEISPISLVTIGYPKKMPSPPPRLSGEEITIYV